MQKLKKVCAWLMDNNIWTASIKVISATAGGVEILIIKNHPSHVGNTLHITL